MPETPIRFTNPLTHSLYQSISWLQEWTVKPEFGSIMKLEKTLFAGQTKFQKVNIVQTYDFGRCLFLDENLQSSQADQFVYHESLVHPCMLQCKEPPKTVFIGGGGEGSTLREVLKHKSVEKVIMCDLDGELVEMCKEHLVDFHQGAFDDPRAEVVYEDAMKYLEEYDGTFDVMILDFCEPLEAGPAYMLYTQEFYKDLVFDKLNEGGVMVTQAGPFDVINIHEEFTPVNNTVQSVFGNTTPYDVSITSFGTEWGFVMATKDGSLGCHKKAEEVDEAIETNLEDGASSLQHYDGICHIGMMSIPKFVRKVIEKEDRIIKKDNPLTL
eukprot:TRINITY_DN13154_c0_g2_i1.p1 TRINITY_DN13154_c0_g2~~TRINITY_DN13154_c0_g2_i1.p1  ORF type:complete len:326 (-),score=108.52 TRINITY_DN13154_c0_g2_i1:1-978(-)